MITDRPLKLDLFKKDGENLGRVLRLIGDINSLLKNNEKGSVTVAVYGDWGTGKTTILKILESYYRDYCEYPVVFFEAWKHQNDENIFSSLILTIAEQSRLDSQHKRALRRIANVFKATAVVTSDILLRKFLNSGIENIEKAFELVEKNQDRIESRFKRRIEELKKYVHKIRENEVKSIKSENKIIWQELKSTEGFPQKEKGGEDYFVLIIDDLDRLLPQKAFEIIENLRFYFDINKILIVMGINDRIINRHVLETYFGGMANFNANEQKINGEKFLDKIFTWTYEVEYSPINELHLRGLENSGLSQDVVEKIKNYLERIPEKLTHRKWVKIANRVESLIKRAENLEVALVTAIILELFPEFEIFYRKYSATLSEIKNLDQVDDFLKGKLEKEKDFVNSISEPHVKEGLKKLIDDKAFIDYPRNTLKLLFEIYPQREENV